MTPSPTAEKLRGFAPAANCSTAPTAAQSVTPYAGAMELRNWKNVSTEAIYAKPVCKTQTGHPLPNIRLVYDATATYATALHRDALG